MSTENHLASVAYQGKKYLINCNGMLMNAGSFEEIGVYQKNGLCNAAIHLTPEKDLAFPENGGESLTARAMELFNPSIAGFTLLPMSCCKGATRITS